MDPKKPVRLGGTPVFLASTKVNLADPDTINWLKASKITRVFCLFPLKPEQFGTLNKDVKEVFHTMSRMYERLGIDPHFAAKLSSAGITAKSLGRNPKTLRSYRSFLRESLGVTRKGKSILVQCEGGKHMSGAYAMFYLASATRMDLGKIRETFYRAGLTGGDVTRIEQSLKSAKVDIREIIETKTAKVRIAAQIKAMLQAKKRKKKKRKTKRVAHRRRAGKTGGRRIK